MIPAFLYKKLANAASQHRLDNSDCRGHYGFLYDRFKPRKWGAEFRILSRKTTLLFATTLLAEHSYPCIVTQLVIISWSMLKQCQEHPYAEVGSAAEAFLKKHPDGTTGWSRGDKLEVLALSGQFGTVAVSLLCSLVDPKGFLNVAVSAATLMFVFLPASYAVRIIWTEWSHKWCSKSATKKRKKIAPQLANKDGEYNNPVVPTGGSGLSFCGECGAQSAGDGGKFCRACGTPSKYDAIEGSGWEAMEPEI